MNFSAIEEQGIPTITRKHPHQNVAEFLFQLKNMLTDNNNQYIEWVNGKEIHLICS